MSEKQTAEVVQPWSKSREGVWTIKVRCPHCGQVHSHGGGEGDRPDAGHRTSDCAQSSGYYLPELA